MPRWSKTSRSRLPRRGFSDCAKSSMKGSAAWPGPPASGTTASSVGFAPAGWTDSASPIGRGPCRCGRSGPGWSRSAAHRWRRRPACRDRPARGPPLPLRSGPRAARDPSPAGGGSASRLTVANERAADAALPGTAAACDDRRKVLRLDLFPSGGADVPSPRARDRRRSTGGRRAVQPRRDRRRPALLLRPDTARPRHQHPRGGDGRGSHASLPGQPRRGLRGGRRPARRCRALGVYVTDLGAFAEVDEAYAEYFPGQPPARTTIGVAA